MMSSVVIPVVSDDDNVLKPKVEENQKQQQKEVSKFDFFWDLGSPREQHPGKYDMRKLIHSIKVGIALVMVSLFFILDPLYENVSDNAIWAIMTVVVIFEFYAGATLCKGILRILATTLGGALGSCVVLLAQRVDGKCSADIIVGCSVFIFGASATCYRLNPEIKKRYDYGFMILLLTFSMVVVSGLRSDVVDVAKQRLSAIAIGFVVCVLTSLLVFPIWSGDEFHQSMTSKFETLASAIGGCLEEYFKVDREMEIKPIVERCKSCKLVLNSKAKDESMANFAKWEPWHGRFGLLYPWSKYIQVGDVLRELAALVLSLNWCLQSSRQSSSSTAMKEMIKEPCEVAGMSITWALRELKESLRKMRKCPPKASIAIKLREVRVELSQAMSRLKLEQAAGGESESVVVEALAIASFAFCLMEMLKRVEELTKEVEELGELADYKTYNKRSK